MSFHVVLLDNNDNMESLKFLSHYVPLRLADKQHTFLPNIIIQNQECGLSARILCPVFRHLN